MSLSEKSTLQSRARNRISFASSLKLQAMNGKRFPQQIKNINFSWNRDARFKVSFRGPRRTSLNVFENVEFVQQRSSQSLRPRSSKTHAQDFTNNEIHKTIALACSSNTPPQVTLRGRCCCSLSVKRFLREQGGTNGESRIYRRW